MKKYISGLIAATLGLTVFISAPASAACNGNSSTVCIQINNKLTSGSGAAFGFYNPPAIHCSQISSSTALPGTSATSTVTLQGCTSTFSDSYKIYGAYTFCGIDLTCTNTNNQFSCTPRITNNNTNTSQGSCKNLTSNGLNTFSVDLQ